MKRILVLDLEVYENYFLAMFKSIDTRKVQAFEMLPDQPLDRRRILAILKTFKIVTFNGNNYDMPMLSMAMVGRSNSDLKSASNAIIERGLKSWQFEQEFGVKPLAMVDHIDLIETVPGVAISLKLYGARMHSERLQDLPIEHNALITPEQHPLLRSYCENDLDTTIDLWAIATNPKDNIIETRERLSAEFGMDMRSKSDAQIAEAMIKISVQRKTGQQVYKPVIAPGTSYKYTAPAWVKFKHPTLQAMFADVLASEFVVKDTGKVELPEALKRNIALGKSKYQMGIGGLHSMEQSVAHVADSMTILRDRDVVSYYPSLILQCGLFPKNMGEHFQSVYQEFFKRRIAAKKAGDKSVAQTLKIVLNGTFGKLGSMYSVLYSPDLMIQVTVTGQLAMLMLIERMEAAGIPVISANTDGVVMACPVMLEPVMLAIVAQWEKETGLETEETQYRALYSRDINNYLALKIGGGYKPKGTLTPAGVGKNPDYEIVNEAVCRFLDKGVPIAETIFHCRDVRKFLRVRRANGGCKWGDQYLGRVARWYRVVGGSTHIEYVTNGNKVGGSDGSMPLMELTGEFPTDIDYGFYLQEATDLLRELGAVQKLDVIKKLKRTAIKQVEYVGSTALARGDNPGTSHEAAASFDTAALELAVLKVVASFPDGCIADKVEQMLPGCRSHSITPRFAPLIRKGLLEDTGRKKRAGSGRDQRVVKVTEKAKELFS
jgi:hypothetical protein